MFVHLWRSDEAIFNEDGSVVSDYRPDPTSASQLRRVAGAVDGTIFTEGEAHKRRRPHPQSSRQRARSCRARASSLATTLAPPLVALAALPLLFVIFRRNI